MLHRIMITTVPGRRRRRRTISACTYGFNNNIIILGWPLGIEPKTVGNDKIDNAVPRRGGVRILFYTVRELREL